MSAAYGERSWPATREERHRVRDARDARPDADERAVRHAEEVCADDGVTDDQRGQLDRAHVVATEKQRVPKSRLTAVPRQRPVISTSLIARSRRSFHQTAT